MRYPDFKNNKTIYLASPSMGCATSYYKPRLKKAISNLKDYGFDIKEGPYIWNEGLLSSTPKNLGDEINCAFKNENLILSVGGGELMIKILDYIDFRNIEPRWFMGYSDNTNLSFLLPTICDIASIYGSCAPEFGSNNLIDYNIDHLKLIKGEKFKFNGYPLYEIESLKSEDNPYENLNLTEKSIISAYPKNVKEIHGRFIGGCIDVLSCILGTKYDNMKVFNEKYSDIIFFFETCDMTPLEVSRRLIQMKNASWFDNTKGIVFGRPVIKDDAFGNNYKDLIIDALSDLNIPLIFDLDIGHVKPQIPVIVGSVATIKLIDECYEISYELK